jgi:uncharacterized membrane protein YadS
MISMGIKVDFRSIDKKQIKVLLLGVIVFTIVSIFGLAYIQLFL